MYLIYIFSSTNKNPEATGRNRLRHQCNKAKACNKLRKRPVMLS